MAGFVNFGVGGGDAGFFKEMGQRRVAAAKPVGGLRAARPPARPVGGGFMPPSGGGMGSGGVVGRGGTTAPRRPTGGGSPGMMGGGMGGPVGQSDPRIGALSPGQMNPMNFNPSFLDGPSQHMFNALPQGLEESFGFAPAGFTANLRRGSKAGFGGMF